MENNIQSSGFVIQPRLQFESLRDQMIYQYLMGKANYKKLESISIGQTIIILSELEKETGWTRRMIKLSLDRLVDHGHIQQETLTQKRGILITVVNYEDYQKLDSYKKKNQKNVQENEHPMNNQSTSDEHEDVQESEAETPCDSKDEDVSENQDVQGDEHPMNNQSTSNVQENEQLISITAFITSLNSINSNKTLKQYVDQANVKNMNLSSTEDIETFVDFALRTNSFPDGTSKKILINYFDTIRLTRSTCRISAKVLAGVIEKMGKYSANQINYALWTHCEKHDDKREAYTLGILRQTKEPEARRGLMLLKNKNGGVEDAAAVGTSTPRNDAIQSKIDAANERRKRIAGIESDRDIDVPF
ncbi:hypothetical protein ACFPRA_01485 [Sporosarcina soli]|uniref:Uncharacterized protein n=1 Tax=Sporosarcina soli TaxID=334736 RepID=A0ABW0TF81_9BACL